MKAAHSHHISIPSNSYNGDPTTLHQLSVSKRRLHGNEEGPVTIVQWQVTMCTAEVGSSVGREQEWWNTLLFTRSAWSREYVSLNHFCAVRCSLWPYLHLNFSIERQCLFSEVDPGPYSIVLLLISVVGWGAHTFKRSAAQMVWLSKGLPKMNTECNHPIIWRGSIICEWVVKIDPFLRSRMKRLTIAIIFNIYMLAMFLVRFAS